MTMNGLTCSKPILWQNLRENIMSNVVLSFYDIIYEHKIDFLLCIYSAGPFIGFLGLVEKATCEE